MTRKSLAAKVLVFSGCYLFFVMQTLATCSNGSPTMKNSTCPCTGAFYEATVCSGSEPNNCDPLGGQLRNCGGSCYKIPATLCGGITLMQPDKLAKAGQLVAANVTKDATPCGSTPQNTVDAKTRVQNAPSEFDTWLAKNLTRGK